jgi:hypothetical protein
MNPPTAGHIASLTQLIEHARGSGTRAIIMIGGGPEGGVLSLDDPITYSLKTKVIKQLLLEKGFRENNDYDFLSKDGLFIGKIYDNIANQLQERGNNPSHITLIQVAGAKDEDTSKLAFVGEGLKKLFQDSFATESNSRLKTSSVKKSFPVSTRVLPIPAMQSEGKAMSATSVRKNAYQFYLDAEKDTEEAFRHFDAKYGDFYKGLTREVFRELLNPLIDNSPRKIMIRVSDEQLYRYIHGTLPAKEYVYKRPKVSSAKEPSAKRRKTRGGRRKRNKTKRQTRRKVDKLG